MPEYKIYVIITVERSGENHFLPLEAKNTVGGTFGKDKWCVNVSER